MNCLAFAAGRLEEEGDTRPRVSRRRNEFVVAVPFSAAQKTEALLFAFTPQFFVSPLQPLRSTHRAESPCDGSSSSALAVRTFAL